MGSIKKKKILLCLILSIAIKPLLTFAVEVTPEDRYKKRKDRWEGIETRRKISGEMLNFMSAIIEYDSLGTANDIKQPNEYAIGFFLDTTANADITVSEYSKRYFMRPLKENYAPGFNIFSWAGRIINKFHISLKDLNAVVEIKKTSPKLVAPAIIYTSPLPKKIKFKRYRFIFLSRQRRVDLHCQFKKKGEKEGEEDKVVFEYALNDQPAKMPILVSWDGKDMMGRNLEDGIYQLKIDACFFTIRGPQPKTMVYFSRDFYHTSKIIAKR